MGGTARARAGGVPITFPRAAPTIHPPAPHMLDLLYRDLCNVGPRTLLLPLSPGPRDGVTRGGNWLTPIVLGDRRYM